MGSASKRRLGYSFKELIGGFTLIIGDVGSGKTKLTYRLLMEALKEGHGDECTVIDLAPMARVGRRIVGGPLPIASHWSFGLRLLKPRFLYAPRLQGSEALQVMRMAERNADLIDEVFLKHLSSPRPILFVNDASLYLQYGSLDRLLQVIASSSTSIVNSYYGRFLSEDKGSGISERERRLVSQLVKRCDRVIRL